MILIQDKDNFLAPAAALDALDREDYQTFESQKAASPDLARLEQEFADISALLSFSLPATVPHARCKQAVMASVSRRTLVSRHLDFDRLLPWAAAAMFAIAGMFMGQQVSRQNYEIAQLRASILGPVEIRTAFLKPADSSIGNEAALAEVSFCMRLQQGRLIARNLSQLAPSESYQLWLAPADGGEPVSAGVFRPRPDGTALLDFRASAPVQGLSKATITIEPFGGVERSENPAYLVGS